MTISLFRVADVSRYGSVSVNSDGLVINFHEKSVNFCKPGPDQMRVFRWSPDLLWTRYLNRISFQWRQKFSRSWQIPDECSGLNIKDHSLT